MKVIDLVQGSADWLAYRKKGIGASDAASLMGVSPWNSPYDLWLQKLDLKPAQQENAAMSRGKALEEIARHRVCEIVGQAFFPLVAESDELPFMFASFDGMTIDNKLAVEIKCPGAKDHLIAVNGKVPQKYYPQLQHQLAVCGLDSILYFSFDGENGVLLTIDRDQQYIDNMIEIEREFYRCMTEFEAPPLTDKDYTERNDTEWNAAVYYWKDAKRRLKAIEIEELERRQILLSLCASQNSRGGGVKVQRIISKGSVSYCDIPELNGIDLDQYRKTAKESWRIYECDKLYP